MKPTPPAGHPSPLAPAFAEHRGGSLTSGHRRPFREATVVNGEPASAYFQRSGISDLARANGGVCSFRFGRRAAIYQITNEPLVEDEKLAPSTDTNRQLFGDFMGGLATAHPDRPAKRLAVERSLGNARFVDGLEPDIRARAAEFFRSAAGRPWQADEFALNAVAHVDSWLPGLLDLRQRPLTDYLADGRYADVIRRFFDIASEVISKDNERAMSELNMIVPFVRELLEDNLPDIAAAGESNLIRCYFRLWGQPLTVSGIRALTPEQLKELGTIVVATFDTTALSLLWALVYLESSPTHRNALIRHAAEPGEHGPGRDRLGFPELVVLEAVRLGGSNPAALWRGTAQPFLLRRGGRQAVVPAGTMLWLDRRQANQDPAVFPNPCRFDPDNIRAIVRSPRETVSSILSRNRYEINSFSMINAIRNPRKCPGRLFSVRMQAALLGVLYADFDVSLTGMDTGLRKYASMPRPAEPGVLTISPKHAV